MRRHCIHHNRGARAIEITVDRLKTIEEMQTEVVECNASKGWYDDQRTFGDLIALLHSEASEALEAYRDWKLEDMTGKVSLEKAIDGTPKPEGVGSEFADLFIRLLDDCARYDIDLLFEYERKMQYNRLRPYRHGGRIL